MPRKKRRPLHADLPQRPNIDAAKRRAWEDSSTGETRVSPNPAFAASSVTSYFLNEPVEFETLFRMLQDRVRLVGWLRIVPEIDGFGSHWMVKFNRMVWPGHYVYFYQREGDPGRMACLFLMRQLDEVAAGDRKPAKDNAWGH